MHNDSYLSLCIRENFKNIYSSHAVGKKDGIYIFSFYNVGASSM